MEDLPEDVALIEEEGKFCANIEKSDQHPRISVSFEPHLRYRRVCSAFV